MGLFTDSLESSKSVLEDPRSEQQQRLRGTALALTGMVYSELDRVDEAVANLETDIEIRRNRQDLSGRLTAQNVLAKIYLSAERFDKAEQLIETTLSEALKEQQPGSEIEARWYKAELALTRQGAVPSLPLFQEALNRVRMVANESLERKVIVTYAGALLDTGDINAAEGLLGLWRVTCQTARLS